jgi:hypothetical protein
MSDGDQRASAAPEREQANASTGQSPFSKPKMEEIEKPPLLPWPWPRKKRAGRR